ncbi:hypothetical protein DCAR_0934212 [Daucus carota subsp. sativus]|uniref:Uncharacterized protein n=1 Tax=Daucus carota subsp. sativus TaxID=79200 RepID=A0A175YFW9_DAUCS|nr:hypothetical protein DCAR_0934212 [Daucus carota subsp. sativus]
MALSALTSPKLFIHVSPSITDEKIREAFAPFGNLRSAKVIKNKALAIVTYDTIQEAEKARKRMHFRRFGGFFLLIESESEFLNPNYEYPQSGCYVYVDLDDLDDYEGVLDLTTRDKFREAFAPFLGCKNP